MRDVSLVVFFFYHSELYEQNTAGFVVDAKRGIQRTWTERREASCAVRDKRIPLRRMSILLYPAKLKEKKNVSYPYGSVCRSVVFFFKLNVSVEIVFKSVNQVRVYYFITIFPPCPSGLQPI